MTVSVQVVQSDGSCDGVRLEHTAAGQWDSHLSKVVAGTTWRHAGLRSPHLQWLQRQLL